MFVLKVIFHLNAILKLLFYRLIYAIEGGQLIVGKKITFRKGFSIMMDKTAKISIGDNVFFNNYCSLNANESITIGSGTIFGENVKIYDQNHCYKDLNTPIKFQGYTTAPVTIGKHCWIASNVTILKGVSIGDNCVIGAGCVVYKNVPANTVLINKQELIAKQPITD